MRFKRFVPRRDIWLGSVSILLLSTAGLSLLGALLTVGRADIAVIYPLATGIGGATYYFFIKSEITSDLLEHAAAQVVGAFVLLVAIIATVLLFRLDSEVAWRQFLLDGGIVVLGVFIGGYSPWLIRALSSVYPRFAWSVNNLRALQGSGISCVKLPWEFHLASASYGRIWGIGQTAMEAVRAVQIGMLEIGNNHIKQPHIRISEDVFLFGVEEQESPLELLDKGMINAEDLRPIPKGYEGLDSNQNPHRKTLWWRIVVLVIANAMGWGFVAHGVYDLLQCS